MSNTVTCPHCQSLLRSSKPIPVGSNLRCPDCREPFVAPDLELPSPARSLFGAPFLIAVTVSVLLGGSVITAALIFATRKPEPVALKEPSAKEAAKPNPDDKKLEETKKKLADAEAKLAETTRKTEHAGLVAKAKAALDKGDFAEAERLYTQALDLFPSDAVTVHGLVSAKSAVQTSKKTGEDDKKRKDDLDALLAEGRKALDGKQFAAAARAFDAALVIAPTDKAARDGSNEAKTALDNDAVEKKRLADYKAAMDAGKLALKTENFAEAVREFQSALRLMPEDLEAGNEKKKAEAKLDGLADKQKRQAAYDNLMDRARKAVGARRYNEAVGALESAVRLLPDDRDSTRDLSKAKSALRRVKAENAQALTKADESIKLGQLDEAKRLLDDAVKNWAEDTQAEKALRNLDRLIDTARTNQVAYVRAVQLGAQMMATQQYAAAVTAYLEAVRLVPTDRESLRQLAIARKALETEIQARVEFDRQMKLATAAMTRRAYSDAISSYQAALRLLPEDVLATAGLSKARYSKAMVDGQRALTQKKKSEAIAAFEAALTEKPFDPLATNGLRQARLMK